jgi:hypothetical protein
MRGTVHKPTTIDIYISRDPGKKKSIEIRQPFSCFVIVSSNPPKVNIMHRPHLFLVGLIAATLTVAQTGPQAERLPACIVR